MDSPHIELWSVIGLLITNAGLMFGMWKYFDARLARVYMRFDEHKDEVEGKYVRKDNCSLLHSTTATNLIGVERRMDERFDKLEKKVDDSFNMILSLLKDTK